MGEIIAEQLEHFTDLSFAERSEHAIRVLGDVSLSPDFVTRFPTSCPVASASAPPSPGLWSSSRTCWSATR